MIRIEDLALDPKATSLGRKITSVSGVRGFYGPGNNLSDSDRFLTALDGYLYTRDQTTAILGKWPEKKDLRFVVARDPRPTGEAIRDALLAGASVAMEEINAGRGKATAKFTVIDIGINTTPVVQNAVRQFDAEGGVMITASHNPVPWNGYKFLTANRAPDDSYAQRGALLSFARMHKFKDDRASWLESLSKGDKIARALAARILQHGPDRSFTYKVDGMQKEAIEGYYTFLRQMAGLEEDKALAEFIARARKAPFAIVFDHNGGAAKGIMPELLRRFGLKIEEMGGALGEALHVIEPMEDALIPASKKLEEHGKGFAVVLDWDADRGTLVFMGDENKAVEVSPQYTCALNVYGMVDQYVEPAKKQKDRPIVVVVNCNTSGSIRSIARGVEKAHGIKVNVAEVETGEINLVEKMEEVRRRNLGVSVIGVEGSCGGVIFGAGDRGAATCRDGTMTTLMAAKIMIATGKPLIQTVNSLPVYHTLFKSIPGINADDVAIKKALESEFESRMARKPGGTFTLAGLDGKEYARYEILHYIGSSVFDKWQKDTSGGYKIRLFDVDGMESFIWYRDSKTEPEVYIESDSTHRKESEYLYKLVFDVVMKTNAACGRTSKD